MPDHDTLSLFPAFKAPFRDVDARKGRKVPDLRPVIPMEEIERVFACWVAGKNARGRQRTVFSRQRIALIRDRMASGMRIRDFQVLFVWAYRAVPGDLDSWSPPVIHQSVWWARYLRGDNPDRRVYLALEDLLVDSKMSKRIEFAWAWFDERAAVRRRARDSSVMIAATGEAEVVGGTAYAHLRDA